MTERARGAQVTSVVESPPVVADVPPEHRSIAEMQEVSRERASERLRKQFKDVQDEEGGGWSVLCPRCDTDTRVQISRAFVIEPCPNGHSREEVYEAAVPAPPSTWGLVWLEDFLERRFPAPQWLYLDLVQAQTTCVIVAPPNAGKTLLALDLGAQIVAKAVSRGAKGLHAVIVEEEGTGAAFQKRLERAFNAAGGMPRRSVKVAWNSGRDLVNVLELDALAEECNGAELVVLDSLADLSSVDENDPGEMKLLGKALRQLQTGTNSTVVALHHMTKDAWGPGQVPTLRNLRGHGALAAKVDTVLALVPGDDEPGRVHFDLYCLKQRDGEKGQPRRVTVDMTGPAATVEMVPIERSGSAVHASGNGHTPADKTSSLKSRALLLLREMPDSGSGLARRLHIGKDVALQLCSDLEEAKLIEREGKKYRLTASVLSVPSVLSEPSGPVSPIGSIGSPALIGGNREPEPVRS